MQRLVGRRVRVVLEPVGDAGVEERLVRSVHAGRSCEVAADTSVRVERGPQLTDRVVEAGPRGPYGDAQGRRDLRQRIPEVVVQDDDGAVFR